MTPTYKIRPVSDRTNFTGKHRKAAFDTPWSTTEDLLIREVRQLGGKDLVVEVDVAESDIRLDGRIRANARPSSPGVRIAFESVHGPLVYSTDRFNHWQDNVRAIALGLEALRKVDRYGITRRGEQYAGWKQLPGGRGEQASHMTSDDAIELLWKVSGLPRVQGNTPQVLWRAARRVVHPDRQGGDRTRWDEVERAAAVLGLV